jgi:predicted alpha/beta-hydrolase family hydrolase
MAQTSMTSFFAGGGKKRSRDDDHSSDALSGDKRHKAASNIVLLTAPGAGGKTSKQAIQLFTELSTRCGFTVCRMDEQSAVSWNKFTPSHQKNMAAVLAAVERVHKKHPEKRILLVGHSFGCRVICDFMQNSRDALQENHVLDAIVCQGYPLLKSADTLDPNNVKRAAHLQNLPTTTKTLIVQGEGDSFLGPRGMASLQDLLGTLEDCHDFSLVQVPKCGHDVTAKAIPQVRQAILDFAVKLEKGNNDEKGVCRKTTYM